MTTQAPITNLASVAARIAQLPDLPMENLWALWDEHFDERPGNHHRTWLESRLAYRIQERAFGDLKPSTRRKLEQIGETGLLPSRLQRDADQLLPGTVLTRTYPQCQHSCRPLFLRAIFNYEPLQPCRKTRSRPQDVASWTRSHHCPDG